MFNTDPRPAKMIPRKKIQLLLCIVCILHAFGNGECALAGHMENGSDDNSDLIANSISQNDSTSPDPMVKTFTEPSQYHTTTDYSYGIEDVVGRSDTNTTKSSVVRSDETTTEETLSTTISSIAESNETASEETFGTTISSDAGSDERTTETFVCKDTPSGVENLAVSSTNTTLVVTWDTAASSDDCVVLYNVSWYLDDNHFDYDTVNSNESTYTITDLMPCIEYNISVVVVGQNDSVSVAQIARGTTAELQISQVNNLDVSGIEYGLNITWTPPEDATSCLRFYLVDVTTKDGETLFEVTLLSSVTNYTFHNLSACTNYTVHVTPISINYTHGTVATVSDAETSSSFPGAVNDLTAPSDNITGNSVYLTWLAPTSNQNCVLYYKVGICYEDNCTVAEVYDEFYNATGLSPCLTYKFTVTAVGEAGPSDVKDTIAETSYIRPNQPTGIGTIPGQYSLTIYWNPPESGSTCTSSYRILLYQPEDAQMTTTNTNVTFYGLYACKEYTGQIIAVSTTMGESNPVSVSGTTESSVNYPPVTEIEELEVTKSTISVSWRINRTMNECELRTVLTTCNFTKTDGKGFAFNNSYSEDDISDLNAFTDVTINVTVGDLSPFSWYECTGVIQNIAGYSESSEIITRRTSEDVPSAPRWMPVLTGSTEFTLRWEEPEYLAGNLTEHEIILSWDRRFLMPSFCDYNDTSKTITDIDGSAREYFYSGASAYSSYTASIRAKTNVGWGDYVKTTFDTHSDVPGPVTNIEYRTESSSKDPNVLDTFLTWKLPCSLNGEIKSFNISVNGIRNTFEDKFSQLYENVDNIMADETFLINFGELKALYNYTFEIYAKVVGVSTGGPPASYNVTYPAGIPPEPKQSDMNAIKIDMYKANRTSTTAWVLLPIFEDTNGEILYYAVMISEFGQNNSTLSRFDIQSGDWPNATSWGEAMSHTPIVTYQATPIRWDPASTDNIAEYVHLKAVKFELGADESCSTLSTASYCNGPLRPDTTYQVVMRAFTSGGYRDSPFIFARTKAEFNLGMVIGVVFGILFLGIITTMMLLIRKGVLNTVLSNILHRSEQDSPGPDPLTRKKFELHCQELIENPGKLSNEFQLLQTLSVDLEMSATAACLQANRRKNRYINILPYDISRVKLDIVNNDPNSDYINASLITGYSGAAEYIACQGPKEETTYDFWRMIFQYNVKIIVMVTQLIEKGKDKCYQYYPNTRENFEYEDMMIRCSTQRDFVFYTQRNITLQKGNITRTIIHLHFKEWSDHGVPDDIHSMINFCQTVRKLMIDNKSLAVVHCSAGVGRTGTLIAIDILLQQIKDNKKLDIFGTVYRLRQHRMNMVQTESQYAYIYNCTKQALNNPYPPKLYVTSSVEPMYESLTKKKREITDSNTNLVNSAETLKKISPSLSTVSMEPISELTVRQRPVYATQLSTLSNGLRNSKSTSAIDAQVLPTFQIDRFENDEYPVFEPAPESPLGRMSMDRTRSLEFARPIQFVTKITRATSIKQDESTEQCGIKSNY